MMDADTEKNPKLPKPILILLSIVSSGGGLLFGYDIGVISGALEQLSTTFSLTCTQQEIVVSSLHFGAILGSLLGGFLIDKCGRKISIMLSCILFCVGGIVIVTAQYYSIVIIARILLGMAMALSTASECVYVSELAPQAVRGALVSLNEFGITVGLMISYVINVVFANDKLNGWRYMFALGIPGAILVFFCILFLPKSPRYLLMNSKNQLAKSALFRVRLNEKPEEAASVVKEFENMEKNVVADIKAINGCQKSMCYPIVIAIVLVVTQQLSGEPNALIYGNTVLLSVGFRNQIVTSLGTVSLGISKVVSTIFCLLLIDKIGRKKFLLSGCAILTFTLFALSAMLFQYDVHDDVCKSNISLNTSAAAVNYSFSSTDIPTATVNHSFSSTDIPTINSADVKWIALVLLIFFVAAYSISFGPVTWIILSEIFPRRFRGRLFSFANCLNWLMNLLVSSTFLNLIQATNGLGWPFVINGIICTIALIFIYKYVPETKGKSLEEITAILGKGIRCNYAINTESGINTSEEIALPLISNIA